MEMDLELDDKAFERYRLDMEAMNRYRMPDTDDGNGTGGVVAVAETEVPERNRGSRGGGKAVARHDFHLFLPSDLHARARMVCMAKGMSLNAVICDLLKDYVNRELRKDPKLREFLGE